MKRVKNMTFRENRAKPKTNRGKSILNIRKIITIMANDGGIIENQDITKIMQNCENN